MISIREKVALVTGGGRGIGKAVAACFAKEGGKVAICARSQGELIGTAKEIEEAGGVARPYCVDIANQRDVQRMVREVVSEWGKIDLLINNASVLGSNEPIATYPPFAWEEVIRINVTGTFLVTRSVIRAMIPKRSGCILSITSSVGRQGRAAWGAYCVSKFALEGMMQVLAEEVAPFGLIVVTVNPGATRTKMRAAAYPKEDPATLQSAEAVAEGLLRLVKDANPALHGKSLNLSDLANFKGGL